MQPMVIDNSKRNLAKMVGLGMLVPSVFSGCISGTVRRGTANTLIGGALRRQGDYEVVISDGASGPVSRLPIPDRGHGVAVSTVSSHAVIFARRPGSYAMVFDYASGNMEKLILASKNRHFYGHGVYSLDGQWLYATEGVHATSQGHIGVYDTANGYQKVEEFTGFGLGPHEVIVMADGTLAVAVGGVHTDGRRPQNLDSMLPSLTYLSAAGEILEQAMLADRHKSIRHLAHDGDKIVLTGQQYRGEPDEHVSLVAIHQRGRPMTELAGEPEDWARFNHYIASIAASRTHIVATSPRGNCYGIWDKSSAELLQINALPDASGVVVKNDDFFVSSGAGYVVRINSQLEKTRYMSGIQWDNHWSVIT